MGCISRINNTQIDDAQFIDVVTLMYNLKEVINNFFKASRISFQYCSYMPAIRINNEDNLEFIDFAEANTTSDSFDLKVKLTGQTGNNGTKIAEIMVLLKYLSDSLRTLEMPLIECEITRDLNCGLKTAF